MGGSGIRRVVVATRNAGKLTEIRSALEMPGWEYVTTDELGLPPLDVVEDGETFADNALLKARAYHEATGLAALADDSGLAVDALHGEPGVRSSRYAGESATDATNNVKLLDELSDVPAGARTARFVCTVVLVDETGRPTFAEGTCEGRIGRAPRGAGGFGYDPLFLPDDAPGRTMAELSLEQKGRISHRGRALHALKSRLEAERT